MATKKTSKAAAAKKNTEEATRYISAVVLDIEFNDPTETYSADEVLLEIFAYTPAVKLREDKETSVKYQAGSYEQESKNVWVGRIEMVREARTHSVIHDPERGYMFADDESVPVTTAETTSFFAYHVKKNVIVYRDSAAMPYTRLRSYVQAALTREGSPLPADITLMLKPRVVTRTIREWFDTFTAVNAVSLSYGHSRSPGNKSVDLMIEAFNAREVRETVVAKPGEELNTEALLDTKRDFGKAVDHLDRNPDNGVAKIYGAIEGDRLEVNTRRSVERHRVLTKFSRRGLIGALVELVVRLATSNPPDDPG